MSQCSRPTSNRKETCRPPKLHYPLNAIATYRFSCRRQENHVINTLPCNTPRLAYRCCAGHVRQKSQIELMNETPVTSTVPLYSLSSLLFDRQNLLLHEELRLCLVYDNQRGEWGTEGHVNAAARSGEHGGPGRGAKRCFNFPQTCNEFEGCSEERRK